MDQKIIQKIKDFYNPQYDNGLYLIVNKQKRYIPIPSDQEIILTFDYSTKNKEDALNHGGIAVTTMDLHKWFMPEDKFKQLIMRWYPDERTKKYLDAVKKNIGLTKVEHGYDGFLPKDKIQLSHKIWLNINGDVEVGEVDGQWLAEYSYRTDIDDYDICTYFFDKKPTKKNILTAKLLEDIEFYFNYHGWNKNTFTCWECGSKDVNWLDIEGNLETKWDQFKEKYCGC